jgi:hypothetical protein
VFTGWGQGRCNGCDGAKCRSLACPRKKMGGVTDLKAERCVAGTGKSAALESHCENVSSLDWWDQNPSSKPKTYFHIFAIFRTDMRHVRSVCTNPELRLTLTTYSADHRPCCCLPRNSSVKIRSKGGILYF